MGGATKDRTWNTLGAKSQHEDLWLTLYTGPTGLYPSVIWSLAYQRSPRAVLSHARYLLSASSPPSTSPGTLLRPPSLVQGSIPLSQRSPWAVLSHTRYLLPNKLAFSNLNLSSNVHPTAIFDPRHTHDSSSSSWHARSRRLSQHPSCFHALGLLVLLITLIQQRRREETPGRDLPVETSRSESSPTFFLM